MSFGVPRWFVSTDTDHRPTCPPIEPESMWMGPEGPAVWDGDRLWISTSSRVAGVPCSDEPVVMADRHHLIAMHDGDTLTLSFPDGILDIRPHREAHIHGVHTHARRSGRRWTATDLTLPLGATQTSRLRPYPLDRGIVWADTGWLYRQDADGVQALGPIRTDERFFVGPRGAVLVGEEEDGDVWWHRCAAPRRALRPWSQPMPSTELRWSADGERIAVFVATSIGEGALQAHLGSARKLAWEAGSLPASGDHVWRPGDPEPRAFRR